MPGQERAAAARRRRALVTAFLYAALLLSTSLFMLEAKPWNLPDYKECEERRLSGIDNDASGLTYSPVTNSLWVVGRVPKRLGEYSVLDGDRLRLLDTTKLKLKDPEGISWMYDYTFAIACEASPQGRDYSSVVIVEVVPWRSKPTLKRTLTLKIDQEGNEGLEAVSWDPSLNKLIMGQEMKPLAVFEVDPETGRWKKIMKKIRKSSDLRDVAGIYRRPGMDGVYALSEPVDTVWELDAEGRLVKGQEVEIRGAFMPEGLSFTPDGALMFVVGEPNELFIYSSIGTCDWSPTEEYEFVDPSLSPSESSEADPAPPAPPAPPPAPISDVGYCNWSDCEGGPQGISWCRVSVFNCVGPCGGSFCYFDKSKAPIKPLPETPPSPPSPPPSPPPPSPWHEDDGKGYCNYRGCDGVEMGDSWCQQSKDRCIGCQGTWCPKPSVPGEAVGIGPDGPLEAPSSSTSSRSSASDGQRSEGRAQLQAQGYQALVTILLAGAEDVNSMQVLQLEQEVAKAAYGYEDAVVEVAVVEVKPIIDKASRRRAQETDGPVPPIQRIVLRLYGETAHHAHVLRKNVQSAMANGRLQQGLAGAGLSLEAQFAGATVEGTGMSPEDFPLSPDVELDYAPEIIVDLSESQRLGPAELASVIGGSVLGATVLVAVAVWLACRRSPKRDTAAPERAQAKGFEELPLQSLGLKKSASDASLLGQASNHETPQATPDHSRQASLATEDTAAALQSACFCSMVVTVVEESEAGSPGCEAPARAADATLTIDNTA